MFSGRIWAEWFRLVFFGLFSNFPFLSLPKIFLNLGHYWLRVKGVCEAVGSKVVLFQSFAWGLHSWLRRPERVNGDVASHTLFLLVGSEWFSFADLYLPDLESQRKWMLALQTRYVISLQLNFSTKKNHGFMSFIIRPFNQGYVKLFIS